MWRSISPRARRRSCAGSPPGIAACCRSPRSCGSGARCWRRRCGSKPRLRLRVFAPAEAQGFWDLARDHYGSHTPISACRSIGQVIRAVTEGRATVGILPMPQEGDADPWWRHLLSPDEDDAAGHRPAAVRRPRQRPQPRPTRWRSAAARSRRPAPTAPFSPSKPRPTSAVSGFSDLWPPATSQCTFFAAWEHGDRAVNLIELDGFVPLADPRLACFRRQFGAALHRFFPCGGYALPLPAAALSPGAAKG